MVPFLTALLLTAGLADAAVVGPGVYNALKKSPNVRVIVSFDPGVPFDFATPEAKQIFDAAVQLIVDDLLGRFLPGELNLRRRFATLNALAGDITSAGVARLVADPRVIRIDLDKGGAANLVEARALARIDPVLSSGFTGRGVTVAVLDSGVDAQHSDLLSSVVTEQCFCSGNGGCCPNATSTQSGPGAAFDDNGHGTNVAGIITSDGTVAPRGAAPDADVVSVKVLASDNSFCCSSDVLAGLDWVLNQRPEVDLVNLSLGTVDLFTGNCDSSTAYTSSYATAVNALRGRGVLVFASSGNNRSSAMAAPACVAKVISVGAVYDGNNGSVTFPGVCTDATTQADQVTCFSNSSAQTDLFAPGAVITSTGLGGGVSSYMGTSQASPMAVACAADLLQAYPGLTPDQLESALKRSPKRVTDPKNGLSFPRLDCQTAFAVAGPDLSYYPLTPCRILDTRNASGPVGGPPLSGGSARVFPIVGSCGIPPSARAISINVTAIDPPVNGEIVLYPGNRATAPNTSTLSLMPGLTRANHAVLSLALDGNGTLAALARIAGGSQVNLVVDVDGYYDQP
jgi:subtilisin family serine protease